MRFTQTAQGHRIVSNTGRIIRLKLTTEFVKQTPGDRHIFRVLKDSQREQLTNVDREIRNKLGVLRTPWNAQLETLLVKVKHGCAIVIGGERVGRTSDLVPSRPAQVEVFLAGACGDGYVWIADEIIVQPHVC